MVELKEWSKVGPKGQVVIPKVFRDSFGLVPGSRVIFELKNDELIIEPSKSNAPVLVFEEIANSGKSVEIIDSDKNYEKMMKERWKKSKPI